MDIIRPTYEQRQRSNMGIGTGNSIRYQSRNLSNRQRTTQNRRDSSVAKDQRDRSSVLRSIHIGQVERLHRTLTGKAVTMRLQLLESHHGHEPQKQNPIPLPIVPTPTIALTPSHRAHLEEDIPLQNISGALISKNLDVNHEKLSPAHEPTPDMPTHRCTPST